MKVPKVLRRALAMAALSAAPAMPQLSAILPGGHWKDTQGNTINAHGGGVLFHQGTYYWVGERRFSQQPSSRGVNVYSSIDLYNWKFEGLALSLSDDPKSEIRLGCIIERPKVLYNRSTGKFVMWFHLELPGQGYAAARTAVAVSDHVAGPYRYLRSVRPNAGILPLNYRTTDTSGAVWDIFRRDFPGGQMARDMTLFQDDDGTAYHIFSSEENKTLHIAELSRDYLSHTGRFTRIFPGRNNEAPAFFRHAGNYFLMASGTTGWDPNPARSYRASSMLGEWTSLGNPCRGSATDVNTTFRSQSTAFIPVANRKNAFIYMGDRWVPGDQLNSRYVWLPVSLTPGGFTLENRAEWRLDDFGPPVTSLRRPGRMPGIPAVGRNLPLSFDILGRWGLSEGRTGAR